MSIIYVWDARWPGNFSFARKHYVKGEQRFGFSASRDANMGSILSQIRALSQDRGQM